MKSFIFDMDQVIAHTEMTYLKSFNRVMKRFNVKAYVKRNWIQRFPGTGLMYIMSMVFKDNKINPKEGIEYWVEKWKREYQRTVRQGKIKPVRGFLGFNKKINKLKLKKIIATGSPGKNTFLVLKSLGVEKEFKIVSSEDIKNVKPDPEIFLLAAARLNVNPKDCIVFEDSVKGIRAAKRAGMRCIALTVTYPRARLKKEKPDWIFDDYTKIKIRELLK